MIVEKYDKKSGAILFKKDPDSLRSEQIAKELAELKKRLDESDRKIKKLEKTIKELSKQISK